MRLPNHILVSSLLHVLDDGFTDAERAELLAALPISPAPNGSTLQPLLQEARLALRAWLDTPASERPPLREATARICLRDGVFVVQLGDAQRLISLPLFAPPTA